LLFSLFASLVIAQLYRYRYVSNRVERQQTKWIVYGFTANTAVFVAGFLPTLIFPQSLYSLVFTLVYLCTLFLYPFTIGIAILRYRLWDIDFLINRTLVYVTLTRILALVYVGSIIALQALLRELFNQTSDVAIIVSTLVIAALFQPLRRRIQSVIDRRFYRRKYNAARTLAAFTATLQNEVDLNQISEDIIAVVQETMQPSHVSLWLRNTESSNGRNTRLLPEIDEELKNSYNRKELFIRLSTCGLPKCIPHDRMA
jgi:hypothetical protein